MPLIIFMAIKSEKAYASWKGTLIRSAVVAIKAISPLGLLYMVVNNFHLKYYRHHHESFSIFLSGFSIKEGVFFPPFYTSVLAHPNIAAQHFVVFWEYFRVISLQQRIFETRIGKQLLHWTQESKINENKEKKTLFLIVFNII